MFGMYFAAAIIITTHSKVRSYTSVSIKYFSKVEVGPGFVHGACAVCLPLVDRQQMLVPNAFGLFQFKACCEKLIIGISSRREET